MRPNELQGEDQHDHDGQRPGGTGPLAVQANRVEVQSLDVGPAGDAVRQSRDALAEQRFDPGVRVDLHETPQRVGEDAVAGVQCQAWPSASAGEAGRPDRLVADVAATAGAGVERQEQALVVEPQGRAAARPKHRLDQGDDQHHRQVHPERDHGLKVLERRRAYRDQGNVDAAEEERRQGSARSPIDRSGTVSITGSARSVDQLACSFASLADQRAVPGTRCPLIRRGSTRQRDHSMSPTTDPQPTAGSDRAVSRDAPRRPGLREPVHQILRGQCRIGRRDGARTIPQGGRNGGIGMHLKRRGAIAAAIAPPGRWVRPHAEPTCSGQAPP